MRKLLYILLLLIISIGAFAQAKIAADGSLEPTGNFPALKDQHLRGGMRAVADTFARNSILSAFRRNGMLVYSMDLGRLYVLDSTKSPIWQEFSAGYTTAQADARFGRLAFANTWTQRNTFSDSLIAAGVRVSGILKLVGGLTSFGGGMYQYAPDGTMGVRIPSPINFGTQVNIDIDHPNQRILIGNGDGTTGNSVGFGVGGGAGEGMNIWAKGWLNILNSGGSSIGYIDATGITSSAFKRPGGTSSQFLKANGSVDNNTYLTSNQNISITGDATGNGTTSIPLELTNTGVIPGLYGNFAAQQPVIQVDAKGRITSAYTITSTPNNLFNLQGVAMSDFFAVGDVLYWDGVFWTNKPFKSINRGYRNISSSTTLLASDEYVTTSSSINITLPTAVGNSGKRYVINSMNNANVVVNTTSAQCMYLMSNSCATSVTLGGTYSILIVFSDGSNWRTEQFISGN